MMSDNFEKLTIRNNFYRDSYRRLVKLLILLSIVAVVLALWLTEVCLDEQAPNYYATSTSGDLYDLQSLSEPVVSNAFLLQWAGLATRAAYNLDFNDYQKELARAHHYFSPAGWSSFKNALHSAGVLDSLQSNKLIMSAVISGPGVILDTEVIHGVYTWLVQLPLLVTYTSANEQKKELLRVSLRIKRAPTLDTAQGLQIDSFDTSLMLNANNAG